MAVDAVKGCGEKPGLIPLALGGNLRQGAPAMADRTKVDEAETVLRTTVRQAVPTPSGRAGAPGSGLHGSVPARPAAPVRRSG